MEINEYVSSKIDQSKLTKELIYNALDMSKGSFYSKLRTGDYSVLEFIQLSKVLNFDPSEWFKLVQGENEEIDKNLLNEPLVPYRKVKNYANEVLKTDTTEVEFLRGQVKELTAIISELSRKVESK